MRAVYVIPSPERQRGSLLVYGVMLIVILGMLYGLYYAVDANWVTSAGVKKGKAEIQAKWDADIAAQKEKEKEQANKAEKGLEAKREKARVVYRTITKEVDKVVTRDVYRNVCLDDDGLRHLNAAIRGEITSAGQPRKPVSTPARVDGKPR